MKSIRECIDHLKTINMFYKTHTPDYSEDPTINDTIKHLETLINLNHLSIYSIYRHWPGTPSEVIKTVDSLMEAKKEVAKLRAEDKSNLWQFHYREIPVDD